MSLKGKMFYICFPLFLIVLTKMIHSVFIVFLGIYFCFLFKRFSKGFGLGILLITIIAFLCFLLPQPLNKTEISGKVVGLDEKSVILKTGYHKVKVYGEFKDISMYDTVSLVGKEYTLNESGNDYGFNYQNYLYSLNIFDTLKLEKIISLKHTTHPYHSLEKKIKIKSKVSSLLSLFILGVKDEQMKDYYEKLTKLSLVHLFALSGMHLMILQKFINQLTKFFFSKRIQKMIALVFIGLYLSIIPYNISFLRAYLMMLFVPLFKRIFNPLDLFSLLTVGMLFYNPYLIYNLSFIFSYTIYFFILLLQRQEKGKYYLFLGSVPIIISIQHALPVFSFLTAPLLMPMVEVVYQTMLYYLILGKPILYVLSFEYEILLKMIDFLTDFSFSFHFSQPTFFFIGVYYYLYLKGIYKINMQRKIHQELFLLLGILLAFYFYPFYNMKGQVVMIDVGQGDCFFIQQPFNKGNILIDTGGLKNTDVATKRIIPYLESQGVFSLDAVFISHQDFDHCGALESLKTHFKVKEVIEDFKEKRVGNLCFKNLALDKRYLNENDRSSIIYVTINHLNYLFTGDISQEVERDLYQMYQKLDVDVLKVAHHGSKTSSSDDLFKMMDPKIALISVGKNNFYRHPSYATLKRLKSYGVRIYRSDEMGMVKIVCYGEKNYVFIHNNP